jgi:hypothetical protein
VPEVRRDHFICAYSALASFKMGMSGSASFHSAKASLLASEAKTQAVIHADEIAKKHNLAYGSVIAALVRQDREG